MGVVNGDKEANLAKIEANLREAAAQGIDIVAFPEEALVGAAECAACRSGAAACEDHHALAETVPGPSTERIAELCRELDLYCAVGLAERDVNDPETLYNASAFIGPEDIQAVFPAVANHRLQGAGRGHDSGSRVLIDKVLDSVDVI